ncbi:unnamed protein product [Euphydryas editha]|uniref:Uncharacterized protein n=1 Tax=Euphydryas editha TaxID=104508 RepID=A0AAU9U4D8_EUPED|nr:unnamed protein product [Euphydryas editha]
MSNMLLIFIIGTSCLQIIQAVSKSDAIIDENIQLLTLKNIWDDKLPVITGKLGELNKSNRAKFSDGYKMHTQNKNTLQNYNKVEDFGVTIPFGTNEKFKNNFEMKFKRQIPGNEETNMMMIGTFQAIMRPMSMSGLQNNSKNLNNTEQASR